MAERKPSTRSPAVWFFVILLAVLIFTGASLQNTRDRNPLSPAATQTEPISPTITSTAIDHSKSQSTSTPPISPLPTPLPSPYPLPSPEISSPIPTMPPPTPYPGPEGG